MCNPRRIEIKATRRVEEAWYASVQESVTRGDVARSESRACEAVDMAFTPEMLAILQDVLRSTDGWVERGDSWHFELPGGEVVFHTRSRELEIIGRYEQAVQTTGVGSRTDQGVVSRELEATSSGSEYTAQRVLREQADAKLDRQAVEIQRALRRAAEENRLAAERRLSAQARCEAEQRAEQQLAALLVNVQAETDREAVRRLVEVGNEGRYAFNRLLAQACRRFFEILARERQGSIQAHEDETSITIELRIPS